MTSDLTKRLDSLLTQGRISSALDLLDNAVNANSALRPLASEAERLRQSYGYMSEYALRSLPDPGLPEAYASLRDQIRELGLKFTRIELTAEAPTLYFNTLRYELTQTGTSIRSLIEEYTRMADRLALVVLAENVEHASRELTQRMESAEKRIFNRVWVTFPLSTDDVAAISEAMQSETVPAHFKPLLTAAVAMGLREYFDERRLLLLMDAAASERADVAIGALTMLLPILWQYRSRRSSKKVGDRLAALTETRNWEQRVKTVTMEFIRARDTERLTRKFDEELLPKMMNLRPEIEKLKNLNINPEEIEENPAWAEMLDESGLTERLRELHDMQEDGGDIMMATFGKLKSFAFFNDIANWFMPFHADHSAVTGREAEVSPLGSFMESMPMFCDNDKYSVMISLSQMPEDQRKMMASQLEAQADQMNELRLSSLTHRRIDEKELAKNSVRNLYRFYKMFRRKGEFADPFASDMNLPTLSPIEHIFDDPDELSLIGEFYFKRRYWADAFEIFDRLSYRTAPYYQLFQKMGYCKQMTGDFKEAIRLYEEAELLNADSDWAYRSIATCYCRLGEWAKAAEYFRPVAKSNPDDAYIAFTAGYAMMKAGEFEEALEHLFRAEFLGTRAEQTLRAIVLCCLRSGDIERGRKYSDMRLAASPNATDFIHAGHLDLIENRLDRAVEHYAQAIAALDFDFDKFQLRFASDSTQIEAFRKIPLEIGTIVLDHAETRASELGSKR